MKKCIIIVGLVLFSHRICAQQDVARQDSLPALEGRVAKIEKILSKLPKFTGFINMRYQYNSVKEGTNSFDIRRARIDFKDNLTSRLDYRLQVDFAGTAKIIDAYVRYKFDRRFAVQAGQFKIPFSLENLYGPLNLETIDNSVAISQLCNYSDVSGISANGRDVGLSFYGGFFKKEGYNIIDYAVGIFNGNGINVKDNNKSKDFSARLIVNPVKYLALSGSYYNGSYGKTGESHSRERVAAGFKWEDNNGLVIRSEYLYGKTEQMESEGVYAFGGYSINGKWQPVVRFDYFQKNKADASTRERDYLAGLNYMPVKWLKFQVNYTYKMPAAGKNTNNVVLQLFAIL